MAIFFNDVQGDVASIFLSYFQRAPEFEAMQHYVSVLNALQADEATAGNAFNLLSAHIYADGVANKEVPAGPTVSNEWYVAYVYENILGRAPDAEGAQYWATLLTNGSIERAELVGTFIASALTTEGRDAAYLANRTQVAVEFAQWENSNPQVLPTLKYNAAEVLLGVDETEASVTAAESRLETSTGPVGVNWNLTSGIDNYEGTTGNDTFNAVFATNVAQGDNDSTFTPFDSINGNLGFDTLNIFVRAAGDTTAANNAFPQNAVVKNIEVVNVYNGGAADASLTKVSNYEGVEEFWQIDSARDVSAVDEDVLVGFRNIKKLGNDEAVVVELAKGVSEAAIKLENVGSRDGDNIVDPALSLKGAALSTVDISGSLALALNDLELLVTAGDKVKALTISTAVDTDLEVRSQIKDGKVVTLIQSIDLSGSAGDIEFLIDAEQAEHLVKADNALTVTFGSGDDVIIFEARGLTLRDNIDGGEGYNTVVLADAGKIQTQRYNAIDRLENIQALGFIGAGVDVNAAEVADFDLVLAGTGAATLRNLAKDQGVTVAEYEGGWPSSLKLVAADADVSINTDDDVTFQLTVDTTDKNSIGATGGTLTLAGEGAVLFSNAAAAKFSAINASELEGASVTLNEEVAKLLKVKVPTDEDSVTVDVGLVLGDIALGQNVGLTQALTVLTSGMNGNVIETVSLNVDTLDLIAVGVADGLPEGVKNSSTYGKMDVIEGFNSNIKVGPLDILWGGEAKIAKEALKLGAADNTLQLAFQSAAQQAAEQEDAKVVYFIFEGNTYLFADTVSESGVTGQYDNGDFALKIIGEHSALAEQWLDASVFS